MRLKKNIPQEGQTKIITKFLWLPVAINYIAHWDIRWLEKATIEYRYESNGEYLSWTPWRFINNKDVNV